MTTLTTLYDALGEVAAQYASNVAIVHKDEQITYDDLIRAIDRVAALLSQLGIGRGDHFAMFAQNCPEFIYCFGAAAKLGAVFIPVNYNLKRSELAYVVEHGNARLLFHDDHVDDPKDISLPECAVHHISELASDTALIPDPQQASVLPTDDLLIVYTSGSTGQPKAVVLDHSGQLAAARSFIEMWGLTSRDTTVVPAPFGFLLGLSTSAMISLLAGMKVVIVRRFHPGEILVEFQKHAVTVFNGVPTMFAMMLEYAEQRQLTFDLSGIRSLICSGAPLPEELRKRFELRFSKLLQNYFGMTECYPLIGHYASDSSPLPAKAVGRIAPGAKLRFLDADGNDCPAGIPGEILARAPSTLKRYHKNPDLTSASLSGEWFRTGDIGYQDSAGFVYITGRIKDLIIKGGNNIAPLEVESVLSSHPAVQDAAVIGVPDSLFGEVPVAFIVLRNPDISAEELLRFASENMAEFKVPSRIFIEKELPVGATGKVDKQRIRARYAEMA